MSSKPNLVQKNMNRKFIEKKTLKIDYHIIQLNINKVTSM